MFFRILFLFLDIIFLNHYYICWSILIFSMKLVNRDMSFKSFFKSMFPAINYFISSFVNDYDVSKDLSQDAFLKVYIKWDSFENEAKAKSFLYVTAKNLCLDYIKHQKIERDYNSSLEEFHVDNLFLHEITKQETMRLLYSAIKILPDQSKKIILLSLRGLNNPDIAAELFISVNTVKSLKKTAYLKLRKVLSKESLWILSVFLNFYE